MSNREIKFRAWDGEKMIAPSVTNFGWYAHHITKGDPGFLMQFTGLKDKNGVEVFEGDVVQDSTPDKIARAVVEYQNTEFLAMNRDKYGDMCNLLWPTCEVIGNIHENPELLSQEAA